MIERIDLDRTAVLDMIMRVLHNKVAELSAGRGGLCDSEACRMVLLGSLVKGMRALSLPLDSRSFSGWGIAGLSRAVKGMTTPIWCSHTGAHGHPCNVETLIAFHIDMNVAAIKGLDLEELFPKKSKPMD